MAHRRGRISAENINVAVGIVEQLPVHITSDRPALNHLVELCQAHQRTAYDALYLDLALREQSALATIDGGLRQASAEAGVEVFQPEA